MNKKQRDQTDRAAINRSLHAYGMEYKLRKEAERTAVNGGSYPAYCLWQAEQWLDIARYWRRVAECEK